MIRKVARSFFADTGGRSKIVQFQASMWNTPDSAEFTINLKIGWPYFHEIWAGLHFPGIQRVPHRFSAKGSVT